MALTRRTFAAATAVGVIVPTVARAKECPAAGMDWMTMSLEARNLAYFNVAHVGADFARQKTESWTAASKDLREQRPKHLDLAYGPRERMKWDLYPVADPKAPCFVHIHGGYWQRGSKEIFACLAEGALANGWSAALPGYTLAPEGEPDPDHERAAISVRLAQREGRRAWHCRTRQSHGLLSAGGHLTAFLLDHPRVAAGLSISDSLSSLASAIPPEVNDKVKLTEVEVETLSPMRRPSVNKPLSIAYGTSELPAMVATSRDYHAYRSESHLPGDLIPIAKASHLTILDELRLPDSHLTREVLQLSTYKVT